MPQQRYDDQGFTLVELLVTMFVAVAVLLALLAVQTSALRGVAVARQRQQATGIADAVMERIRAMSQTTNCTAVSPSELTGDPNINGGTVLRPLVSPSISETLVTDCTGKTYGAPLTPHTSTTSVGTTAYTSRTYVTQATGPRDRWLTVLVTWSPTGGATPKTVISRSRIYV